MSQDGADLGYTAEQGMKGALGGEEPKHTMTVAEMDAYLSAAPEKAESYDDAGRIAAKIVRDFLLTHPEAKALPADDDGAFDYGSDGRIVPDSFHVTREGLYTYLGRIDPSAKAQLSDLGLSGFQWGWAVNAARWVCELAPVSNPAILEVSL